MSGSVISFLFYCAGTFLAIAAPACFVLYYYRKKKTIKPIKHQLLPEPGVNGDSSEWMDLGAMSEDGPSNIYLAYKLMNLSERFTSDRITTADAEYAEELQFYEASLESLIASGPPDGASSSVQELIAIPKMLNYEHEQENSGSSNIYWAYKLMNLSERFISDRIATADDEHAEELQFYEASLESLVASAPPDGASSSVQELIPKMLNYKHEQENSAPSFCEICLDNKESWQMFENDKCSHSFCYECTSNHIISKIQENMRIIPCPALYCKAMLNFEACQMMVPNDILIKWDEMLCLSLIPDSQKLYCPFLDCLALLVNDSGQVLKKIECLSCKRSFCVECHVPWHSEFTCEEFRKLYARKGRGKDEKIVKKLAAKKNWKKCPKCKMIIEKAEGCLHITCRCKYEFCYRCGSKWTQNHGGCKTKRYNWKETWLHCRYGMS